VLLCLLCMVNISRSCYFCCIVIVDIFSVYLFYDNCCMKLSLVINHKAITIRSENHKNQHDIRAS
jgi:hypothetical protein